MLGVIRKLKCPKTGKRLKLDSTEKFLEVEDSDIRYPLYGPIINFIPEIKEQDFFVSETDKKSLDSLEKVMADEKKTLGDKLSMPEEFRALVLDIPSGGDLFVGQYYARYREANILVADSNPAILARARQRYESLGINNAFFICCNLDNLPLLEGAIGMAVSILGFNRVKEKKQLITEIKRVLRVSGTFNGAFYIQSSPSQQYLRDMGLSSDIFSSMDEVKGLMSDKFDFMDQELLGDKFVFECRKSWPSCGVKW